MKPKIEFDGLRGYHYLIVDNEFFKDHMEAGLICQKCSKPIFLKHFKEFYICPDTLKWFCRDCELKEGELKEDDFLTCSHQRYDKEHHHPLIKEIDNKDETLELGKDESR